MITIEEEKRAWLELDKIRHTKDFKDKLNKTRNKKELHTYKFVVANPPYSIKWDNTSISKQDQRFKDYKLPPKTRADYGFILHILHSLKKDGVAAVLLPMGVLYREGAEQDIRTQLIKENKIDTIIALPKDLFFNTSVQTVIIVFKKNKTDNDIFFIDASNDAIKENHKYVLSNDSIDKIIKAYSNKKIINNYSYSATAEEVIENNYNLNIKRYIDNYEVEEININSVIESIEKCYNDIKEVDEIINSYCSRLNIPAPVMQNNKSVNVTINKDNDNNLIPFLRFKEYNDTWTSTHLKNVSNGFVRGGTPRTNNKDYWNGNINWFVSGELDYKNIKNSNRKITNTGLKSKNLKILPIGTFIIAISGLESDTCGRCAILGSPAAFSHSCVAILNNKQVINTYFLFYWWASVNKYYGFKYAQGSLQKDFTNDIIKNFPILYPSLEEQEEIAMFLFCISKKITRLKELNKNYKSLLKYYIDNIVPYQKEGKYKLNHDAKYKTCKLKDLFHYTATKPDDKYYISIIKSSSKKGKILYSNQNFKPLSHMIFLTVINDNIDTYYSYFITYKFKLDKTPDKINRTFFNTLFTNNILLPDAKTQQSITEFLGSYETKIYNLEKLIRKLEQYKAWLLSVMYC